ncbi:MAG: ornithine carbamoyltransferase [Actinomycetota bacterium]|nr:ornithine carbamoyltransferase [Actinomycetota bacterium]
MSPHAVLRLADLGADGVRASLDLAEAGPLTPVLAGRGAALLFEHPSARTRNAAELAVVALGGHPVTIRGEEVGLDRRETVEDVARTLGCFHAVVAARVARHGTLERMATALEPAGQTVVVNLLSDVEHPTQALADLLTIRQELGRLEGTTVAYVGDANNVCRSLVDACALSGAVVRVAAPAGHQLAPGDLERAAGLGGDVTQVEDPLEAVAGADVVYTDVWVSMGEEAQAAGRRAALQAYQVNESLLAAAAPGAIFLHCLPAHRGEEVTAGVLEGARSRVWQQAANRLHALRGLLGHLLGAEPGDLGR